MRKRSFLQLRIMQITVKKSEQTWWLLETAKCQVRTKKVYGGAFMSSKSMSLKAKIKNYAKNII